MKNQKAKMWLWFVLSFALIALVLLAAAGTFDYWRAWIYIVVGAATSILLTLHMTNDPILLENRTKAGPAAEQRPTQKLIVLCMGLPVVAALIVPALDRRFGWSKVPSWLSIAGDVLIIVSMWIVFRVFKENPFGSATVEVTKNQKVISTGPYAVVRHPMYASAAVYFIGMSLALGSYWGLIASALIILGFVWRLFDEEEFLVQNLSGYKEYCATVRWRLVPGLF